MLSHFLYCLFLNRLSFDSCLLEVFNFFLFLWKQSSIHLSFFLVLRISLPLSLCTSVTWSVLQQSDWALRLSVLHMTGSRAACHGCSGDMLVCNAFNRLVGVDLCCYSGCRLSYQNTNFHISQVSLGLESYFIIGEKNANAAFMRPTCRHQYV